MFPLALLALCVAFGSLLLLVLPRKAQHIWALLLVSLLVGSFSLAGLGALLSGQDFVAQYPFPFWSGTYATLVIDPLSGFFLLIAGFVLLMATIYAGPFLAKYQHKTTGELGMHYTALVWLGLGMMHVLSYRDGFGFLISWEIMSLSSFFLLLTENNKPKVLTRAITYMVQMHVGAGFLLLAFLLTSPPDGNFGFAAIKLYLLSDGTGLSGLGVFSLFLIGFGMKAGMMPLHTWLPDTYNSAPAHVSAVLAGGMKKVAIYGLLRVLTEIPATSMTNGMPYNDLVLIGCLLLFFSAISGLLGIMNAVIRNNLKRLLAYSSIENVGIIGLGLGMGCLGSGLERYELAALGFGGALLHSLNHALYKPLLFFATGGVEKATGERDMLQLGGLGKSMPWTSAFFLIGALSVCALPPFNGFVSEFLLYEGLFGQLPGASVAFAIILVLAILTLVLIGGLALFTFGKAFGLSFLGSARSEKAARATEVSGLMLLPQALCVIGIVAVVAFPSELLTLLAPVLSDLHVPATATSFHIPEALTMVSVVFGLLLVVVGFLLLIRRMQQKGATVVHGPTWGCGYTAGTPKHQYTGTSFADSLFAIIRPILGLKSDYESIERTDIFPKARHYKTQRKDLFDAPLRRPVRALANLLGKATVLQTGKTQHYIAYAFFFLLLMLLLTYLGLV